jgi:hypothetical protein
MGIAMQFARIGDYAFDVTYSPDESGHYGEVWLSAIGKTIHTTELFKDRMAAAKAAGRWIAKQMDKSIPDLLATKDRMRCIDSVERLLVDKSCIRVLGGGRYEIVKADGTVYQTVPGSSECSCMANLLCKHIYACAVLEVLLKQKPQPQERTCGQ